eukprot:Skav212109  [mRNA]  locus=scaffold686:186548:186802:- [translate_table: standard]
MVDFSSQRDVALDVPWALDLGRDRASPEVRRSMVLKHFAEEAERLSPKFPLHLLSDIDQTVFIGTFGAGWGAQRKRCEEVEGIG